MFHHVPRKKPCFQVELSLRFCSRGNTVKCASYTALPGLGTKCVADVSRAERNEHLGPQAALHDMSFQASRDIPSEGLSRDKRTKPSPHILTCIM